MSQHFQKVLQRSSLQQPVCNVMSRMCSNREVIAAVDAYTFMLYLNSFFFRLSAKSIITNLHVIEYNSTCIAFSLVRY